MNLTHQEPEIIDNVSRYFPNISIFLPFEEEKSALMSKLESATCRAETQLAGHFSPGSNDRFRARDILYYTIRIPEHPGGFYNYARYFRRSHKFSFGIREAWTSAQQNNIRLLVVERDLKCFPYDTCFYGNDIVDSVIEKVLENGGEAELVGNGVLKEYEGVAFIKLY